MAEKRDDLPEQYRNRLEKAEKLRELGGNPYRNDFKPTATSKTIKEYYHWHPTGKFDENGKPIYRTGRTLGNQPGPERFSIAGRVMLLRSFGKAAFATIRDRHGDIQVYVRKDRVGEEMFKRFKLCDLGDIIGVTGGCFLTKTGELTVMADYVEILTKALQPLPEKWKGLRDIEKRYRQRYLDLIANPEVAQVFRKRTAMIKAIREFLDSRDFLEVETPMMHPLIGGAAARPFETYHNALDRKLYLRIAPELYLKRLLVGGFERVYEINRNFRNEGISTQHNPEFTMLEFYLAYATYEDLISLSEELISYVAQKVCGTTKITYQGTELDFSPPWRRMTLKEAIYEYWNSKWAPQHNAPPLKEGELDDPDRVSLLLDQYFSGGEEDNPFGGMEYGEKLNFLFEEVAEEHLIQPTFITQFPTAVSPLARRNPQDPEYTDRFEIFVYGRELGNAFSELNDPLDQKERFIRQLEKKEAGDQEAMDYDADFITALEHGMPPAAGEGIGIDRLCMFLCDAPSIRDVILFPQLKN